MSVAAFSRQRTEAALLLCTALGSLLIALRLDSGAILGLGVALLALPLLVILLVAPRYIFDLLIIGSLVAGTALSTTPIDVGVRVYPLDLVLVLAVAAALLHSRPEPQGSGFLSRKQAGAILILVLLGIGSAVVGVASGNADLEIVGTFRRMFFYPVMGFAISMFFIRSLDVFKHAYHLVVISGVLLFGLFLFRLFTGVGYQQEAFSVEGETIRYLSYNEAASLTFALLCATSSRLVSQFPRERRWTVVLAVAFTLGVIGSNYRTAWLAMLAGLLALAFAMGLRHMRIAIRLLLGSLVALAGLVTILLVTPLGTTVMQKFTAANLLSTGSWRLFSWLKATSVFLRHPVLGVGLGYKHEFVRLAGDMQTLSVNEGHTIHNDLLWVLVNTGIVGMTALVITWARLLRGAAKSVRHSGDTVLIALVAAAFGELAVLLVTSFFQPTVSLGSSGILFGLIAALFCRAAEFAGDSAVTTGVSIFDAVH